VAGWCEHGNGTSGDTKYGDLASDDLLASQDGMCSMKYVGLYEIQSHPSLDRYGRLGAG